MAGRGHGCVVDVVRVDTMDGHELSACVLEYLFCMSVFVQHME